MLSLTPVAPLDETTNLDPSLAPPAPGSVDDELRFITNERRVFSGRAKPVPKSTSTYPADCCQRCGQSFDARDSIMGRVGKLFHRGSCG